METRGLEGTSGAKVNVTESVAAAAGEVNLNEADIIVSGGRGLKAAENYKMIEDLAPGFGARHRVHHAQLSTRAGCRTPSKSGRPERQ